MAFLAEVARATRDLTTFVGTYTVPVLAGVSAGNTIMLAVNTDGVAAGASYTATDSNGNTWNQRALSVAATPNNAQVGILTCQVSVDLTTLDTISVTATGRTPAHWMVLAHSFDDITTGFDLAVTNTQTATSAVTVGPSATAAQNAELLYVAVGYTANPTFTAGAGFTEPAGGEAQVTVNTQRSLAVEWQYVNVAGTRSATATLGSNQANASALVAQKQTLGAVAYNIFLDDNVGVTDTTLPQSIDYIITAADGIGVTDARNLAVSPNATYTPTAADAVGITDVLTATVVSAPTGLVATPQPDNWPPRIKLELTATTVTTVTIYRIGPNGRPIPVRGGDPATTTSGLIVVYDYEAPHNRPVYYTAATRTSSTVTLVVPRPWLYHPGVPSLSQPIQTIGPVSDEESASAAGVHEIAGRTFPIVVTDGRRKSPRFPLQVLTDDETAEQGMVDLFYDTSPLLLQIPGTTRTIYRWVSVGSVVMSTPGGSEDDMRLWSMPCIEVDRPAGGIQVQRTWATLAAECATWADVAARYTTWRGVLTGEIGT
jgi:hypothetical protein